MNQIQLTNFPLTLTLICKSIDSLLEQIYITGKFHELLLYSAKKDSPQNHICLSAKITLCDNGYADFRSICIVFLPLTMNQQEEITNGFALTLYFRVLATTVFCNPISEARIAFL